MKRKTIGNVVSLAEKRKAKPDTRRASEKKFGKPVMDLGFCIVPSLLMKAQARLGVNPVQFNIIMQLMDSWWEHERRPWPGKKLLAGRLNMSERQVQRQIAELEQAGLVSRIARTLPSKGKTTNAYDLSGLVAKLKEMEPEFAEVQKEARDKRVKVTLPKHKRSS